MDRKRRRSLPPPIISIGLGRPKHATRRPTALPLRRRPLAYSLSINTAQYSVQQDGQQRRRRRRHFHGPNPSVLRMQKIDRKQKKERKEKRYPPLAFRPAFLTTPCIPTPKLQSSIRSPVFLAIPNSRRLRHGTKRRKGSYSKWNEARASFPAIVPRGTHEIIFLLSAWSVGLEQVFRFLGGFSLVIALLAFLFPFSLSASSSFFCFDGRRSVRR